MGLRVKLPQSQSQSQSGKRRKTTIQSSKHHHHRHHRRHHHHKNHHRYHKRKHQHHSQHNQQPEQQQQQQLQQQQQQQYETQYFQVSQSHVTRCPCGSQVNEGLMIQCEACMSWQHARCIGITKANAPSEFYCQLCRPTTPTFIHTVPVQPSPPLGQVGVCNDWNVELWTADW